MHKFIFTLCTLFSVTFINAQVECVTDVVILEGDTLEMCADAPMTMSASNGFVSYNWSGPEVLTGQVVTPNFTGTYVVAALDPDNCTSHDTIVIIIHPNPTPSIISSEGNPICSVPGGSTLSLSAAYSTYDWGGANTSPTFFASGPGAYAVTVTDVNGCTGHDVITLTEYQFGVTQQSALGCSGDATLLIASGGTNYSWSTGETADSIVVSPTVLTTYTVTISAGTCSELFSIDVPPGDTTGFDLGDTIYVEADETVTLTGPFGFDTYSWSPSNDLDNDSLVVVQFTAGSTSSIVLEATHPSGCVFRDTVVIIVVDLTIPNGFSPNGDIYNEYFVIPELEYVDGALTVWNRWGDVVLETSDYNNDWRGTCETALCAGKGPLPEGTYFYHLEVQGVNFEGYITLKR